MFAIATKNISITFALATENVRNVATKRIYVSEKPKLIWNPKFSIVYSWMDDDIRTIDGRYENLCACLSFSSLFFHRISAASDRFLSATVISDPARNTYAESIVRRNKSLSFHFSSFLFFSFRSKSIYRFGYRYVFVVEITSQTTCRFVHCIFCVYSSSDFARRPINNCYLSIDLLFADVASTQLPLRSFAKFIICSIVIIVFTYAQAHSVCMSVCVVRAYYCRQSYDNSVSSQIDFLSTSICDLWQSCSCWESQNYIFHFIAYIIRLLDSIFFSNPPPLPLLSFD